MHNNIAIDVKNLTKIYHLYDQPQDRLKEALNPFKKSYHRDFYAMHDVSFSIKKGDTVGIIGKNGAGKSTLLKMITGVLTPTSGTVKVDGKIASLLELGAGFNPEMSGIENIYLNGTLMGFTHEEMSAKIDAILEFADIGDFIHQPVKMYSSGMFARLAFSVAINIDADILIVDEVLSVGDINFQAKSMNKMKEMINHNITVLFVTHDINAIKSLCSKAIYINNGQMVSYGKSSIVSDLFVSDQKKLQQNKIEMQNVESNKNHNLNDEIENKLKYFLTKINKHAIRSGSGEVTIDYMIMLDDSNQIVEEYFFNDIITIEVAFTVNKLVENLIFAFYVKDKNFLEILGTNSHYEKLKLNKLSKGTKGTICFKFKNKLKNGNYFFQAILANELGKTQYYDFLDNCIAFKSHDIYNEKRWALVAPEIIETSIKYR